MCVCVCVCVVCVGEHFLALLAEYFLLEAGCKGSSPDTPTEGVCVCVCVCVCMYASVCVCVCMCVCESVVENVLAFLAEYFLLEAAL